MTKCTECGRNARRDKKFCWYHDPDVSDLEKLRARQLGGLASRKFPVQVKFEELEDGLNTLEGLWRCHIALIRNLWDKSTQPAASRVLAEHLTALKELYVVKQLEARLMLLESGGQRTDEWHVLENPDLTFSEDESSS